MVPRFAKALPDPVREAVEGLFARRRARRGRVLFYPDDEATEVYYLQDGWVRLFALTDRDEELTLAVVGPGELFGEAALLPESRYGVFAEVMNPGSLFVASGEALLRLGAQHPEVYALVVRLLTERLWRVQARMKELRYKEVRPRLVRMLLALMREGDRGLEVALSHQDLAHLIGSTRETVTKILGELALQEILELGYRKVIVHDPEALAGYAE